MDSRPQVFIPKTSDFSLIFIKMSQALAQGNIPWVSLATFSIFTLARQLYTTKKYSMITDNTCNINKKLQYKMFDL